MALQVQKEYRKFIYKSSWLPESVRLKYGKVAGSGVATTVQNHSSSSSAGRLNVSVFLLYFT